MLNLTQPLLLTRAIGSRRIHAHVILRRRRMGESPSQIRSKKKLKARIVHRGQERKALALESKTKLTPEEWAKLSPVQRELLGDYMNPHAGPLEGDVRGIAEKILGSRLWKHLSSRDRDRVAALIAEKDLDRYDRLYEAIMAAIPASALHTVPTRAERKSHALEGKSPSFWRLDSLFARSTQNIPELQIQMLDSFGNPQAAEIADHTTTTARADGPEEGTSLHSEPSESSGWNTSLHNDQSGKDAPLPEKARATVRDSVRDARANEEFSGAVLGEQGSRRRRGRTERLQQQAHEWWVPAREQTGGW
eukprot:Rmarinus@m.25988